MLVVCAPEVEVINTPSSQTSTKIIEIIMFASIFSQIEIDQRILWNIVPFAFG